MTALFDPRKTLGEAVTDAAATNDRVVVLSADSGGSSGMADFAREHPERYFECGIQEQAATGTAAGLATMGLIPVLCAIAPFVTCRNYEQMRNDLGYMRQNVKIVGRNGGFSYSALGSTHHSLEDYALMRMIPGLVVLAPQDRAEIREAVFAMIEYEGPVYLRIGATPVPELFAGESFGIGKGRQVRRGGDVTLVSTGTTTPAALAAADGLAAEGLSVDLIGLGTVVPLDEDLILASAARTGQVITVEEHYDRGGLGGAVAELLSREAIAPLDRIGVPAEYVPTGPYQRLLEEYDLDPVQLARRVRDLVDARRARTRLTYG